MEFEDRFMAEEDKNFLIRILKSLARGNLVQVQRVAAKAKVTANNPAQAQATAPGKQDQQASKLNQTDKDNIKNILDMFGDRFQREFIQKVYLMNNKQFEQTLDMFLTENLPDTDEKPQLTIIETAPKVNDSSLTTINTMANQKSNAKQGAGNSVDMRSYVLDEYREVLFPKHKTKHEKAHAEHLERQKLED